MRPISFNKLRIDSLEQFRIVIYSTIHDGYITADRIKRDTVPEDWYIYDLRFGDNYAVPFELKNGFILANFYGTFITRKKLPIPNDKSVFIDRDCYYWFIEYADDDDT